MVMIIKRFTSAYNFSLGHIKGRISSPDFNLFFIFCGYLILPQFLLIWTSLDVKATTHTHFKLKPSHFSIVEAKIISDKLIYIVQTQNEAKPCILFKF